MSVPKTIPDLSANSRKVNGRGVAVAVLVGTGVFFSVAVAVGKGVYVGTGVVVGKTVFVGAGTVVGVGVTPHAARVKPMDDVPHNLIKSRRVRFFISPFTFCA